MVLNVSLLLLGLLMLASASTNKAYHARSAAVHKSSAVKLHPGVKPQKHPKKQAKKTLQVRVTKTVGLDDIGEPAPFKSTWDLTIAANQADEWISRPFNEFLEAQGQSSVFIPPVPDYLGWGDSSAGPTQFALIDYAGLANDYIIEAGGTDLGTTVEGEVIERELEDGTAEVRVRMVTKRALCWGFDFADFDFDNPDFSTAPTNFGVRADDVLKGAKPAVGKVTFEIKFINEELGAPFPDLVRIAGFPDDEAPGGQDPIALYRSFKSTCLDDSRGKRMEVIQGSAAAEPGPPVDEAFILEICEVVPAYIF